MEHKENLLRNTKNNLVVSTNQRNELLATNTALNSHINNTVTRLNRSVDEHVSEVHRREYEHSSSLERLIATQNATRLQLESQINQLRGLVNNKKRELHEANVKTTVLSQNLGVATVKKVEAHNALNYWNNAAVRTEAVKNSQILGVEHARVRDLNHIQNVHHVDMNHHSRNNLHLSGLLHNKEVEQHHL